MSKATVVVDFKPAVFDLMAFIEQIDEDDMVLSIDRVTVTDNLGTYIPFTITAPSPFTRAGRNEDQADFEFDFDPVTGQFRINTDGPELTANICIEVTIGQHQETI